MLASASQAIIIGFNVRPRPRGERPRRARGRRTSAPTGSSTGPSRTSATPWSACSSRTSSRTSSAVEVRATFRAQPHRHDRRLLRRRRGRAPQRARPPPARDRRARGRIASLQRFNEDVREVDAGFECGVLIEDYNDVKEGDEIEAYELREVARTSQVRRPAPPAAESAPAPRRPSSGGPRGGVRSRRDPDRRPPPARRAVAEDQAQGAAAPRGARSPKRFALHGRRG